MRLATATGGPSPARALDAAIANGALEVIAVIADTGNPASRALHRALGFSDVGTLERVGHKFGRWIDVCLMQKSLRNAAARPDSP